ncbi:MAG: oxidoreductase [Bacteroidota bacterium]
MKNTYLVFISIVFISSCVAPTPKSAFPYQDVAVLSIDTFAVESSVRALQAVGNDNVWFAGSNGLYGNTLYGVLSWKLDSIVGDSTKPQFRAIAVTEQAVHLLNVGSPAHLIRSIDQGASWDTVYQEDHPNVFYDAMAFWDTQNGIAMGDPTAGCLSVIRTEDGGKSWTKVDCENVPAAAEGEAAFAASNTNLSVGKNGLVWMVSGGKRARVYKSQDYGKNWEVFDTPIVEGEQMTGIYSVAFYDDNNGIIFGGNWNDKASNYGNNAITTDGGQNWTLVEEGVGPGYRSCVRYLPESKGQALIAAGSPGLSQSVDGGKHWQDFSEVGFYTFDTGNTPNVIWLAGSGQLAKLQLEWKD